MEENWSDGAGRVVAPSDQRKSRQTRSASRVVSRYLPHRHTCRSPGARRNRDPRHSRFRARAMKNGQNSPEMLSSRPRFNPNMWNRCLSIAKKRKIELYVRTWKIYITTKTANIIMKTSQFKTVCNWTKLSRPTFQQRKQQKYKVLLLSSILTAWLCDAKIILFFIFFCFCCGM